MSAFRGKARTAETYLAGLGASGALTAGAIVAFIMLVGVVTFNAWPNAAGLFNFSQGQADVTLDSLGSGASGLRGQSTPLVTVTQVPAKGGNGFANGTETGSGGVNGLEPGTGRPGGSEDPRTPDTTDTPRSNAVSDTVSALGNNVQSNTDSLGNALGAEDNTLLGGLVKGLGNNLNSDLQGLSGILSGQ